MESLIKLEYSEFKKTNKSYLLIIIMKVFITILFNKETQESNSLIDNEKMEEDMKKENSNISNRQNNVKLINQEKDKIQLLNDDNYLIKFFSDLFSKNLGSLSQFIIEEIKKALSKHLSIEIQYELYKIVSDYESNFVTTIINKISTSFGIIVFPLREILEYYGIILDKKTVVKNAEKLNSYIQERIETFENKIKI